MEVYSLALIRGDESLRKSLCGILQGAEGKVLFQMLQEEHPNRRELPLGLSETDHIYHHGLIAGYQLAVEVMRMCQEEIPVRPLDLESTFESIDKN